jgi:hypothetical protein
MIFCVFSFNRGRFLENCIGSIESCVVDPDIIIFDDNSDDPGTIEALKKLSGKHRIETPGSHSNHRLGGLYGNMQRALEICADESLVFFLQDDTQLVRPLSESDIDGIHAFFDSIPGQGFLSPCFIRGRSVAKGAMFEYDDDVGLFYRQQDDRSVGRYFSALLIMQPQRLLDAGWAFRSSEPENEKQAATLFKPMGYLKAPFAMWLPEVPAYRGKKKTFGLRLAEKKRRCGFYPFRVMTGDESAQFSIRAPDGVAVAEDYLECEPYSPSKPWAYNPLTDMGWRKLLSQMEVTVRKLWGVRKW